MVNYTFATLDQWTKKTKQRTDAVVKDATQTTISIAQKTKFNGGRMPVITGNLRNSLQSSIAGGASGQGEESYIMVAATMKGGDLATFTWGNGEFPYARPVNNGRNGRPGAHFVEGAVDQWPAIVRASIAKAKARVG